MLKLLLDQKVKLSPGEHAHVTISARTEDDKFVYYTFIFEMLEDGMVSQKVFESDSPEEIAAELARLHEVKEKPNLRLVASNTKVEPSVDELFEGNWWENNK